VNFAPFCFGCYNVDTGSMHKPTNKASDDRFLQRLKNMASVKKISVKNQIKRIKCHNDVLNINILINLIPERLLLLLFHVLNNCIYIQQFTWSGTLCYNKISRQASKCKPFFNSSVRVSRLNV
jgi:hypothetical protein